MNKTQLIAIVTEDAKHLADVTIYEPITHNGAQVDAVTRMVTNAMQGQKVMPMDLGMNSHFSLDSGIATIRFVDPDKGGNSRPLITIVPREGYKHMLTKDMGASIAAGFVRHEQSCAPSVRRNPSRPPSP